LVPLLVILEQGLPLVALSDWVQEHSSVISFKAKNESNPNNNSS
jgi:hypothetical protein